MRRNDAAPLHLNVSIVCMMLLVMVLSIACASAPANLRIYSEEEEAKAEDAIRLLLERTSTAAPENMFVTKADIGHLEAYIPQTAQGILDELDIIPGIKAECQKWLDAVYPICSSLALTIPERLAGTIATMQIQDAQAIVRGGTTSSTSLLDSFCSDQLEQELQQTLRRQFSEKADGSQSVNEIWDRIVNKYNIWRTAQFNLTSYSGRTVPKEISGDTAGHLARLICDMFFTQMAIEEDAIRTTPKPQDDSLVAEVFGINAQ
ncbi:MAG: DUF4197 family protein [Sphaerochaetaceae bacterium]|nr:DUF4197 family protein [Sphaerochaetaceae bacterium]